MCGFESNNGIGVRLGAFGDDECEVLYLEDEERELLYKALRYLLSHDITDEYISENRSLLNDIADVLELPDYDGMATDEGAECNDEA